MRLNKPLISGIALTTLVLTVAILIPALYLTVIFPPLALFLLADQLILGGTGHRA